MAEVDNGVKGDPGEIGQGVDVEKGRLWSKRHERFEKTALADHPERMFRIKTRQPTE